MTRRILKVPFDVLINKELTEADKQVYTIIYQDKDEEGFYHESTREIANTIGLHIRTVSRSIERLEKQGLIAREIKNKHIRKILVD